MYQSLGGTKNVRVYNVQPATGLVGIDISLDIFANGAGVGGVFPVSLGSIQLRPPDPSDPTGMTPWGVATGGVVTAIPSAPELLRATRPGPGDPDPGRQQSERQPGPGLFPVPPAGPHFQGRPVAGHRLEYRQHCRLLGRLDRPVFLRQDQCGRLYHIEPRRRDRDDLRRLRLGPVLGRTQPRRPAAAGLFLCDNLDAAPSVHVVDSTHILMAFPTSGAGPYGQMLTGSYGASGQVLLFTGTRDAPVRAGRPRQRRKPTTGGDSVVRDLHWTQSMPSSDAPA